MRGERHAACSRAGTAAAANIVEGEGRTLHRGREWDPVARLEIDPAFLAAGGPDDPAVARHGLFQGRAVEQHKVELFLIIQADEDAVIGAERARDTEHENRQDASNNHDDTPCGDSYLKNTRRRRNGQSFPVRRVTFPA